MLEVLLARSIGVTLATQGGHVQVRYRVGGMDCPSCVAKIESATRVLPGIATVKVSIASQMMTIALDDEATRLPEVERTVTELGYQLDRIGAGAEDEAVPSHVTPAYRRALWIVVLLNVGYGIIEAVGGFIAGSQSLKADALDFLGDGLITFLGLVAIGWSLAWRARAALIQGVFLGLLGIGVLANTAYRIFFLQAPEPIVMGVLGMIALVVNVAAAIVLLPHRSGDANARAIWLFSRNDAIGNLAVVVAAGLVAWTRTPWPDLIVAGVIAALFLHSASSIIRDARNDLRQPA
jgi:Co/Zn/Cd efflux system component/copper chaperone CopZ